METAANGRATGVMRARVLRHEQASGRAAKAQGESAAMISVAKIRGSGMQAKGPSQEARGVRDWAMTKRRAEVRAEVKGRIPLAQRRRSLAKRAERWKTTPPPCLGWRDQTIW